MEGPTMVGLTVVGVGWDRGLSWMRPWVCVMGWGWLCWWVKAIGCGFMVVGLLGGGHRRGWGGFGCGFVVGSNWGWGSDRGCWGGGFCGSFVAVLWSVLVAVCVVFFFFWWLQVEVVVGGGCCGCSCGCGYKWWAWKVQAMEVFRANIREREKLLGLCRGFFFLVFGGWRLRLWLVVVVVAVVRGDELEILGHWDFESKYQREGEASKLGWERWRDSGRERQRESEK